MNQHHQTQELNWQTYKELELIPNSAPAPQAKLELALPLVAIWRSLLNALARERVYGKCTDYLERCWALDYAELYTAGATKPLKKFWMLLD